MGLDIIDVLDTLYHDDDFTCTLVCLMSDSSVQSIERKVCEVEVVVPTNDFVDCPF